MVVGLTTTQSVSITTDVVRSNLEKDEVYTTLYVIKIAFHTMLTQDIALGESQTVIFEKVITNNGKGYNRHTGQFTATRDGTYYFTTSFLSAKGNVHLQMMKNAEVIGYSSGYPDNGSSGSISATVNFIDHTIKPVNMEYPP
jgi:hypothetical protein